MVPGDENVFGLDVAVHDTLRMRISESVDDLAKKPRRFLHRKLTRAIDTRAQILAGDERHRIVEQRNTRSSGEQRNDVRMLQPCGELNLATNTLRVDGCSKVRWKHIDDHL